MNKLLLLFLFISLTGLSYFLKASDDFNNLQSAPSYLKLNKTELQNLKQKLEDKNIPGGVVLVELKKEVSEAYFQDNKLLIIQDDNGDKFALAGLDLKLTPSRYLISTNINPVSFFVKNHHYEEQRITLKKDKQDYVVPPKEVLDRIKKERIRANSMIGYRSDNLPESLEFIAPTTGTLTSFFGLKRYFNDIAKNPHNGIDFANNKGTEIKAVASGKIIDTHNYYYNGNTVFIDHGGGLISVYIHLSEINVEIDQDVKKGDVIGLMGQTGRTTGVNLHFGMYLNGSAVDPLIFLTNLKDTRKK